MKKINILTIIWSLGLGGAEQVVIDINNGLNKQKFHPIICCLNGKGMFASRVEKNGIPVIPLFKKPKFDPHIILKIYKLIQKENIDLVQTHLWTANFWGRIAAWLAGVKIIIATEHTTDEKRPWFYYLADKLLASISSKIITVSESVKSFHSRKADIPKDKFEVIKNGIQLEKWQKPVEVRDVKANLEISEDEVIIGTIGRLVQAKRYDIFLKAVAEIVKTKPNIRAIIIGEGPLESELKNETITLGIQNNVKFTGFRKDIPKLIKIFDIFVLSSEREGLPVTLLEAMATGIACVVTRVGGNPEVINNYQNGILVNPLDYKQLSEELDKLIENQKLRIKLSQNSKEWVKNYFSISRMVNKTEDLYSRFFRKKSEERIKILFIIDHLDSGGAQRQMIELVNRLDKSKYEITVCNLDEEKNQLAGDLREKNIPIFSLNQFGKLDIKTIYLLSRYIKRNRFSIIHTYLFTADCYGRIAAKLSQTPIIIASLRSVDSWKNLFHIFVDKILSLFSDKIIVNANMIKTFLTSEENIVAEKIQTIHNGIDLDKWSLSFQPEKLKIKYGIKKDDFVIGILARNDPVKDHETYFKAAKIVCKKIPNVKFLAIGDGMENKNMRNLTRHIGIEKNVILKDYIPNVAKIIEILDISTLTSLIEGCPNIILESMIMKKPVVATNVGGIPELVINNLTGYLVPPQKPQILANKFIHLLESPNQRYRFGENGYNRVVQKFSMTKMVKSTEKIYRTQISNKMNS